MVQCTIRDSKKVGLLLRVCIHRPWDINCGFMTYEETFLIPADRVQNLAPFVILRLGVFKVTYTVRTCLHVLSRAGSPTVAGFFTAATIVTGSIL